MNEEKGYLYTAADAVTVQDEKGKYLTSVPVGKIIQTDGTPKTLTSSVLDNTWQKWNTEWDAKLAQGRLEYIKSKLQALGTDEFWFQKLQRYLRTLVGMQPAGLPITLNDSGSGGISISLDVSKLKAENIPELEALYEGVSNLKASEDTLSAKMQLR